MNLLLRQCDKVKDDAIAQLSDQLVCLYQLDYRKLGEDRIYERYIIEAELGKIFSVV
ncbi:MAG TPA: hypothetical protein VH500_18755 [Nitrososphaeraceae archaeon]